MTLEELATLIESNIRETKEYAEFMKLHIKPKMTTIGSRHYDHLHFFNLGYQFAMEKMLALIDGKESS